MNSTKKSEHKKYFRVISKFKILNSKLPHTGFTMVMVLAAFLVLFVTVSLIKVGTLDQVHPDLRRIGINWSPNKDQNLAQNPQPSAQASNAPTNLVNTNKSNISVASSNLEISDDSTSDDSDNEGDNPKYIE